MPSGPVLIRVDLKPTDDQQRAIEQATLAGFAVIPVSEADEAL